MARLLIRRILGMLHLKRGSGRAVRNLAKEQGWFSLLIVGAVIAAVIFAMIA